MGDGVYREGHKGTFYLCLRLPVFFIYRVLNGVNPDEVVAA